MIPEAYVCHAIPHRARLRFPKERDPRFFSRLKAKLEGHSAVQAVEVNPATGSVLLRYAGGLEPILRSFREQFALRIPPPPKPVRLSLWEGFHRANRRIKAETEDQWDLRSLTVTGLFALTFLQITRGRILPPAWTLYRDAILFLEESLGRNLEAQWRERKFG